MEYNGTYAGFVVDNADPAQIGRVKVRVPCLHGTSQSSYEIIADADLPWALPAGMPSGNSSTSGGLSHIPGANDQVWVRYLDGELEKPIWEWGNQTIPGISNYPDSKILHSYESDGSASARSSWMRYNQQRTITPSGITDISYGGYSCTIADSLTPSSKDGSISWATAAGYSTSLDDGSAAFTVVAPNFYAVNQTINFYATVNTDITCPLINLDFARMCFIGDYAGHVIDGISRTLFGVQGIFQSLGLGALSTIGIGAPNFYVTSETILYDGSGVPLPPASMVLGSNSAGEVWLGSTLPEDGLVRLSDLQYAISQIKYWLQTHQHAGVKGGGDISGPPVDVPVFDMTASANISCEATSSTFSSV